MRLRVAGAVAIAVMLAALVPTAAAHPPTRPDGQPRIAFSRVDDAIGGFALWTATPNGTDQQRLTPGAAYFPSWAPDRSHLLFDFPDDDGGEQIGRIDADGSNFQQLTDLPGVSEAADYSPSGGSIVFDRFVPQGDDQPFFTSIWVMDADGGNPRPLFGPTSTTFDVEPDYSPDGSEIVFSRIGSTPSAKTRPTRCSSRPPTVRGSAASRPSVRASSIRTGHPTGDGCCSTWSRRRTRGTASTWCDPNGHGLHRILRSNETFIFYKPDFAPDGKRLVFGCFVVAEQQEDICTLDPRGRRVTRVVSTPGASRTSPSGAVDRRVGKTTAPSAPRARPSAIGATR